MFSEYGLRGSLVGHQEDARAVIVCDIGIVTASRDKTIKIWTEAADGTFTCTKTTGYVTALAYKDGELVSGSADQSVFVWDLEKGTPRHRLRGHGWAVTAVAISDDKKIISASQDRELVLICSTIRVWNNGACEAVLEGHTKPVHCLLVLPSGAIVSGSGDCTIRIWQDGQSKVLKGHTDTVREETLYWLLLLLFSSDVSAKFVHLLAKGLALVPNIGFVSASHDFTLRGHQAIIYSAAVSSDGFLIASASEDKTSRLWALDGTLHQTLVHPVCRNGHGETLKNHVVPAWLHPFTTNLLPIATHPTHAGMTLASGMNIAPPFILPDERGGERYFRCNLSLNSCRFSCFANSRRERRRLCMSI
eukprot:jgi/Botrbrau1/21310/Bobra.0184s0021.1